MSGPAWLQLLRGHCKDNDGLSLPYLVGGAAYLTDSATIEDAITILEQMRTLHPSQGGIYLSFCSRLQIPVFTILPENFLKGLKIGLDRTWGNTDSDKIEKVLNESKEPIVSAQFSRTQEMGVWCWRGFTKEEKTSIISNLKDWQGD